MTIINITTKAHLENARDLIKGGHYEQARKLLKTVKHPTATTWLLKLDEIAPVKSSHRRLWILGGVITACVVVIAALGFMVRDSMNASSSPLIIGVNCGASAWWYDEAEPITVQFLDTAETAVQTGRVSLSPIILELRQIQRAFEALDYPDCARIIRNTLARGMDSAVGGYNDFLGQSDTLMVIEFNMSTQKFADAHEALMEMLILSDYRMLDASIIWGGASPTQWIARVAATQQADGRQPLPPTWTPVP